VRDVGIGSRWRFEGIYQDSPCWSVGSRLLTDHSPMEARRGRELEAGFIVDKVAIELSELVMRGIVISCGRQGIVV